MRFWLLAATVTGASFGGATLLFNALAAVAAPMLRTLLDEERPRARARAWFGLRMLPLTGAVVMAFAVAAPIFLWFEPRDTDEPVRKTLIVLAAFAVGYIGLACLRLIRAWDATRCLAARWRRVGRELDGLNAPIPAYAIEEPFPIVAIVGVLRPRLFIAEQVLRECPAEEVAAMIGHECAHVARRDNLRRFLLRACPPIAGGVRIVEREWQAAVEEAADAAAVWGQPGRARVLADALIRVARMATPANLPDTVSAFYLDGSIESRIRRLLNGAPEPPTRPFGCLAITSAALVFATAVVMAAPMLHEMMEAVVRQLP